MDLIVHLRYFVAVAEHRHFGRAAQSLGVTQPPVSQGVRRLEEHLGLKLFERTREGTVLTVDGSSLLPRARVIVDDAARFIGDAHRRRGSLAGLRWGCVPQLDDELLARCTFGVQKALSPPPDHSVIPMVAGTAHLLSELRRGALHLAVVQFPADTDGLDTGPVITVPRSVVLPAGHPAATSPSPRPKMLDGLRLVSVPREHNPPTFDLLVDSLRRRGLDPETGVAATHRDVATAAATGSCFGFATPTAPVHTGTVHTRMLSNEAALRLRLVTVPGVDLSDIVYAVDRELLRGRK
ncbi:LysR family transcriptional regulator [Rhodococcus sp. BP-149]|uniref:LysR family transcriptional regulator n=1 Tax=unclassified Rhodococcus (in: high G+C Gram-positive bacteria) TaxID=192944 RepID=UPI001C9B8CDB|nr:MULTISPECIES: LysR family transcriptional regulator [unclassified Rhodococcus (in: high G+C Gram-positive bacteria)]MBY6686134.1 LysR family transcriptional regulator [Rhodococcus sp. BP-288]MBY6693776.1 LysR family transcriptional regulator [Rhodococcus sp. BP-188]MBY6699627.1 LysR family transcriptional regulator [Rhodococcus sp. BP-285]MBY6704028.1 LysR family transcriptional regulator [Rhodococcus sp. BP-283]MBY6710823.1 LysR family transcriptional regulator [Rhodococcus sp. BP-160]